MAWRLARLAPAARVGRPVRVGPSEGTLLFAEADPIANARKGGVWRTLGDTFGMDDLRARRPRTGRPSLPPGRSRRLTGLSRGCSASSRAGARGRPPLRPHKRSVDGVVQDVDLSDHMTTFQLGGLHDHIVERLARRARAMTQSCPTHDVARRGFLKGEVLDRAFVVAREHISPKVQHRCTAP